MVYIDQLIVSLLVGENPICDSIFKFNKAIGYIVYFAPDAHGADAD